MIPIRDSLRPRRPPIVTYALIGLNVAVFLAQLATSRAGAPWLTTGFALIPTRIVADPSGEAFTLLTSMFLHASWAHLAGNMLFLHIFGDNVEDALGHVRYLLFYVGCGVAAALIQVGTDPWIAGPYVGASGAIAGVLGAYLVCYPRAPVLILNLIPPLWLLLGFFFEAPAWLVLGYWFLLQNVFPAATGVEANVAFFAHIGGFVVGAILIRLGAKRLPGKREAPRWHGWRPTSATTSVGGSPPAGRAARRRRARRVRDLDAGDAGGDGDRD